MKCPGHFGCKPQLARVEGFFLIPHPPTQKVEEGSVWRRVWLRHGTYEMAMGLSPKAMHSAMIGRQHTLWEKCLVELGDGWWAFSNGME